MGYQVFIKFPADGSYTEYSSLTKPTIRTTETLFDEKSLKFAQSNSTIEVFYDSALVTKLNNQTASDLVDIYISLDGTKIISGFLRPIDNLTLENGITTLSLDIVDYSFLLDKPVGSTIEILNGWLYNSSNASLSIITQLINQGLRVPSISAPTMVGTYGASYSATNVWVPYFIVNQDDNLLETLREVCFANGFSFYFDSLGVLTLKPITVSGTPTVTFSEANLNIDDGSFKIIPSNLSEDSVKVNYRYIEQVGNLGLAGGNSAYADGSGVSYQYASRLSGSTSTGRTTHVKLELQTQTDGGKVVKHFDHRIRIYQNVTYRKTRYGTFKSDLNNWEYYNGVLTALPNINLFPNAVVNPATVTNVVITGNILEFDFYHGSYSNEYEISFGLANIGCMFSGIVYSNEPKTYTIDGARKDYLDYTINVGIGSAQAENIANIINTLFVTYPKSYVFDSLQKVALGTWVSLAIPSKGFSGSGIVHKVQYNDTNKVYSYSVKATGTTTLINPSDSALVINLTADLSEAINGVLDLTSGQLTQPIKGTNLPTISDAENLTTGLYLGSDKMGYYDSVTKKWVNSIGNDGSAVFQSGKIANWEITTNRLIGYGSTYPDDPAGTVYSSNFASGVDSWTNKVSYVAFEGVTQLLKSTSGAVLATLGTGAGDAEIFKSLNNGDTWYKVFDSGATATQVYLGQITYTGTLIAYVYGAAGDGDVYRSTDDGDTWTKFELGSQYERVIFFVEGANGVAIVGTGASAGDGDVYRTTDDGVTWTKIKDFGTSIELVANGCYLGNNTFLVGLGTTAGDGDIWRSTDNGATWSLSYDTGASIEYTLSFLSLGGGVALASTGISAGDGDIYRTADYGASWTKVYDSATATRIDMSPVKLSNGVILIGSGSAAGSGDIYRSTDNGLTFTPVEMGASLEYIIGITEVGTSGVVLCGAGSSAGDGDVYRSTDYGLTWTKIYETGSTIIWSQGFLDLGSGVVLGYLVGTTYDAQIIKSIDSGATWTLNNTFNSGTLSYSSGSLVLTADKVLGLPFTLQRAVTVSAGNTIQMDVTTSEELTVDCMIYNGSWSTITSVTVNGSKSVSFVAPTAGTYIGIKTTQPGVIGATLTVTKAYVGNGNYLLTAGLDTSGVGPAIFAGKSDSSTAPFRVNYDGSLYASKATITGEIIATSGSFNGSITSTSGTIGGFVIGSTYLDSDITGVARARIDKTNARFSYLSSANTELTSMGNLAGLKIQGSPWDATKTYAIGAYVNLSNITYKCILSNTNQTPPNATYWAVSTDVYPAGTYGFWAALGTTLKYDGTVDMGTGEMLLSTESSIKLKSGTTTLIKVGSNPDTAGLYGVSIRDISSTSLKTDLSCNKLSMTNGSGLLTNVMTHDGFQLSNNGIDNFKVSGTNLYTGTINAIPVASGTNNDITISGSYRASAVGGNVIIQGGHADASIIGGYVATYLSRNNVRSLVSKLYYPSISANAKLEITGDISSSGVITANTLTATLINLSGSTAASSGIQIPLAAPTTPQNGSIWLGA